MFRRSRLRKKGGDKVKEEGKNGLFRRSGNNGGGRKEKHSNNSVKPLPKKPSSWLSRKLEELEKAENPTQAAEICRKLTQAVESADRRGGGENEESTTEKVLKVVGLTSFAVGLALPLMGVPMMGVPDVLGLDPTVAQIYDTTELVRDSVGATDTIASLAPPALLGGRAHSREEVVQMGGIPVLITALRRHIKDLDATIAALRTLWELTRFTVPWDLIYLKTCVNGGDPSAAVASYYSQVWVKSNEENFAAFTVNGGHLLLIEAIQEHTGSHSSSLTGHNSAAVPDLACCILGTLVEGGCNIQHELLQAGAVSVIMNAMKQYNENVWFMTSGLAILRILAGAAPEGHKICTEIVHTKGNEMAFQALALSQQDAKNDPRLALSLSKLAEDACVFLSDLAYEHNENTAKIGRLGIEKILDTMRYFNMDMAVQNFGFLALIILSCNAVNQEKIGSQGGIDLALDILRNLIRPGDSQGADDDPTQSAKGFHWDFEQYREYISSRFTSILPLKVCDALFMFVRGNRNNADRLVQQDGIQVLLETVAHFLESLELQNMVVRILMGLSEHGPLVCEAIVKSSGVTTVFDFMKQHNLVSEQQDLGCQVLLNLLRHVPNIPVPLKDILDVVLGALRNHPEVASLQQKGFELLKHLAEDYQTAESIANEGGITVVLDAMKRHPNNWRIQASGCDVMRILPENPGTHVAIMEKKDEISEIADALLRNPNVVCQKGGTLMRSICPLIESQNAELIVQELSRNPKYIGMFLDGLRGQTVCTLQTGCKVIKMLANNSARAQYIAGRGGVAIVADAMSRHPKNIEVQFQGCAALANLAEYQSTHGTVREQEGVIAMVHDALERFPDEVSLQREGRRFLRNVAVGPSAESTATGAGGGRPQMQQAEKKRSKQTSPTWS